MRLLISHAQAEDNSNVQTTCSDGGHWEKKLHPPGERFSGQCPKSPWQSAVELWMRMSREEPRSRANSRALLKTRTPRLNAHPKTLLKRKLFFGDAWPARQAYIDVVHVDGGHTHTCCAN